MPSKEEYWKDPEKHRLATRQYAIEHPDWKRESGRKWKNQDRDKDPEKYLTRAHADRAMAPRSYLVFCPVLGLKLAWCFGQRASANHSSPSIDRIIPEFGYVRDNIRIISNRANHLKNNASPRELRSVADYAAAVSEELFTKMMCGL